MTEIASTAETQAVDPREARAERRLRELERLSRIGMEMAEALGQRVADAVRAGEAVDGGAVALEFSRLSRAVRQTLALEARFDAEGAALGERLAAERAARRAQADRLRTARIGFNTDRVRAAVSQLIEAEVAEDPENEREDALDEALLAFLEDPREEDAIADLPVSALIGRICQDLGVAADWSLWEDEDWAVAEWREAVRGSPYAPRRPESVLAAGEVETGPGRAVPGPGAEAGLEPEARVGGSPGGGSGGAYGAPRRPQAQGPPERRSA